jgi:ATP-binding cassette subfamily B protein
VFKKYPFVKQEGIKDCGCACLLMIMKYYNGNASIEYLRRLTYTNKNGTNAYNLVNASIQLGFEAKGFSLSFENLNEVNLPCIAHVIIDEKYKHYIVIYKILYDKKKIVIADPSSSIKSISFEEFNKIWTGVIINLYPSRSIPFYKNIDGKHFIFKNIFKHKKMFFSIIILSFFVIVLKIALSFYFMFIVNGIDISKNYLIYISIVFSFLTLVKVLFDFLRNRLLILLNCKLDASMVMDSFKHIVLLPYHYYHNRTTGEIVSKINDLENARDFISKICVSFFIDFPLALVSLVFLVIINYKMFFISIVMLIFYIVLSFVYRKSYQFYIGKIKNLKESVNSYMYEAISGFETVKGINIENKVIDRFNLKYTNFLNNVCKLQKSVNMQMSLKDLINDLGNILVLFFGAFLVLSTNFSLGYLITYITIMAYFLEPIRNIIDSDISVKECFLSINRIISLYEKFNCSGTLDFSYGNIEFRNLSFSYPNGISIFKNLSLTIHRGEHVMIYGSTGVGKSSLFKLLMRYYQADSGNIFLDGVDINDLNCKSFYENVSYISQNEILFNDTLINNLNFYTSNNDDIKKMSEVFEFNEILNNDLGFNMLIEENGFNLSGGQRQRIVLARTFLKNSQIILIDEGFSQIDVCMERKILKNVFDLYSDKTIMIVSHRMENLDLYDRVIRIDNEAVSDISN